MSEKEFRGSIGRGANIGDLLVRWFRIGVIVRPCDAEVCDVCWTVDVLEKDVGGFDISMDDIEGMEVGETREETVENGGYLFVG